MKYTILDLKPSDVRWLEDNVIFENHRHEFFQRLYRMLIHDSESISHLDTVYCSGAQLQRVFVMLHEHEQQEIRSIKTLTSKCFLDGVSGLDFEPQVEYSE